MIQHPCEYESKHQVCGAESSYQDRNGRFLCYFHAGITGFLSSPCALKPIKIEPMNTAKPIDPCFTEPPRQAALFDRIRTLGLSAGICLCSNADGSVVESISMRDSCAKGESLDALLEFLVNNVETGRKSAPSKDEPKPEQNLLAQLEKLMRESGMKLEITVQGPAAGTQFQAVLLGSCVTRYGKWSSSVELSIESLLDASRQKLMAERDKLQSRLAEIENCLK